MNYLLNRALLKELLKKNIFNIFFTSGSKLPMSVLAIGWK